MECDAVLSASLIRRHVRKSQEFSISLEKKKNIFAASIEFSFLSLRTRLYHPSRDTGAGTAVYPHYRVVACAARSASAP
jgi:hypothetical protein